MHPLVFVQLCDFIKCSFVYFTVRAVNIDVHISHCVPRLADISLCFNFEVPDIEETDVAVLD